MQRNIINEMMENLSPKFLSKAALALNETESGVSRGLENLIPSILYQLNHQLDGADGNQFFQLLKKEKNITLTNQLDGLLKGGNKDLSRKSITGGFIEKLFGGQQKGVLDFVSQRNQIKTKSAQSLMTIASALVMGYLSKMIRKDGVKLDSLKSLLLGQQNNIEAALPAKMTNRLGNIRPLATAGTSSKSKGAAAVAYASTTTATAAASGGAAAAVSSASSGMKYLWLLPLLLLLLLGGWYFLSPSSTTTNVKESISQKENSILPATTSTSEQLEEVEDELAEATKKLALENKIETTTANNTSTIDTPSASDNSISTGVKKAIKKESIAEVTISEPELMEEIDITAASSPGRTVSSEGMSAKGNRGFNNTDTNINNSGYIGTSMSVDKPAVKVRYEDYIEKVKIPEQVEIAASKIERKVSTVLPEWYTESKKVVNGNSSHVTVIKKTETILDGRNTTSDALSELRKSLSLTTYNAWFGHVANPISSTEYRFYSYLSDKQNSSNQTDKYTWFTLDKVNFPKYDSRMDFDASKGQLGRIANILSANPDVTLKIGGFTSDLGKKKDNRNLSLEMAEQTKAALVKLGVAENRISVKGYGESNPISLNDTELGRMRNHRVGFRVMSK